VEIEGSIKEHQEIAHFGINKTAAAAPPPILTPPKPLPKEEPQKTSVDSTDSQNTINTKNAKPKKRYLNAAEIITLLQNTNKQFPLNEIQGCPLSKEEP
jgi:hypothetical protein